MVGRFTGGSLAADIGVWLKAGVLTSQPDASLVGSTIRVSGAFSVTSGVGISQEIWRAGTLGTMVYSLAVGIFPTHSLTTCSLTPIGDPVTLLRLAALIVRVAFVSTTLQRVPNIGVLATADWPVIGSHLAVSVGTTGSTDLLSSESATVAEWISSGSPGTPANGHMVLHGAVGTLATRDGTRVDALVVLTRSLWSTVLVLIALSLDAS